MLRLNTADAIELGVYASGNTTYMLGNVDWIQGLAQVNLYSGANVIQFISSGTTGAKTKWSSANQSNYMTFQAATTITDYTLVWPGAQGAAGTTLINDGSGNLSFTQPYDVDTTIITAGTTGAATINKPAGRVNFAATDTSLVVTNSLVTTSTFIFPSGQTNDTTCTAFSAVPASGSFTIYANAACTAETAVAWTIVK